MSVAITGAQIAETAAAVFARTTLRPSVGLILGSGLGELAGAVEDAAIIPVDDLPHWPASTAPGHQGRLVIGHLQHKPVIVLQGRVHFYEGYSMQQITLPVRVMHRLGVETQIITNAAGGMNPQFRAGDLMLIRDHINMPGMAGNQPLRGPNDDAVGPRFPDMTVAYDADLRRLAHEVAAREGFGLREGVYAFVAGPSYETPAELRLLSVTGGDAVGMSTVPEVVVARHAGIRVLGISTITNMALADPPPNTLQTHEDVVTTGKSVVPRLTALIGGILAAI
jgi:purine-nucleoside phosphorylase